MELLALNCQHCSAPLQVPAEAKFVTCTHCGSQLAVRKTGSVAYTETLDAIDERTEKMAEQLDELHRRSRVTELDREWEARRSEFLVRDKDGDSHRPTKGGSVAAGLGVAAFGMMWTFITCGIGGGMRNGPGAFGLVGVLFPLFGVVFTLLGLWTSWQQYQKAEAYERALRRYRQERDRMLHDGTPDAGVEFDAMDSSDYGQ